VTSSAFNPSKYSDADISYDSETEFGKDFRIAGRERPTLQLETRLAMLAQ
jgi:hypothetical protein